VKCTSGSSESKAWCRQDRKWHMKATSMQITSWKLVKNAKRSKWKLKGSSGGWKPCEKTFLAKDDICKFATVIKILHKSFDVMSAGGLFCGNFGGSWILLTLSFLTGRVQRWSPAKVAPFPVILFWKHYAFLTFLIDILCFFAYKIIFLSVLEALEEISTVESRQCVRLGAAHNGRINERDVLSRISIFRGFVAPKSLWKLIIWIKLIHILLSLLEGSTEWNFLEKWNLGKQLLPIVSNKKKV